MVAEPTYSLDSYVLELTKEILLTSLLQLQYKKELTYETFYLILSVVLKKHQKKKSSEAVTSKKTELLLSIDAKAKQIYSLINPEDVTDVYKSLTQSSLLLNDYVKVPSNKLFKFGVRYQFKKQYYYNYSVPFILNVGGQKDVLLFSTIGIPKLEAFLEPDINIVVWVLKRKYPNLIFRNLIIYDLLTLQRTVVNFNSMIGDEMRIEFFTRLFQIDTISVDKRYGENCEDCPEKTNCTLMMFRKTDADKVFNRYTAEVEKLGRKLTKKEKTEILKKTLADRCTPQYYLNKWGKDVFE